MQNLQLFAGEVASGMVENYELRNIIVAAKQRSDPISTTNTSNEVVDSDP